VGEGGAQHRIRGACVSSPSPAALRASTSPTWGEVKNFDLFNNAVRTLNSYLIPLANKYTSRERSRDALGLRMLTLTKKARNSRKNSSNPSP